MKKPNRSASTVFATFALATTLAARAQPVLGGTQPGAEPGQPVTTSRPHLAGLDRDCQWQCRKWTTDEGDEGSNCSWECPPEQEGGEPVHGVGPNLAFLNLHTGDVLAGQVQIQGFAMEFFGDVWLEFFWNGSRVVPTRLQTKLLCPEACTPPLGHGHAHCRRESGFLAEFDTTRLPDGPGTFALLATEKNGWTSTREVQITINNANCGDLEAPAVQIVEMLAGRRVGGVVAVEVMATDNLDVAGVELLIDGKSLGVTTRAPFVFEWKTEGQADGPRRLVAKAFDACSNRSRSEEITVVVSNRQTPFHGANFPIPGRIEIEHYDLGLAGVTYSDSTAGNAGGQVREDDVDIEAAGDAFILGQITEGEWLEYSIDVPTADEFRVCVRSTAKPGAKTRVRLEIDGKGRTHLELWESESERGWMVAAMRDTIRIEAGQHVLRLEAESEGYRLDWLELIPASAECAPTGR